MSIIIEEVTGVTRRTEAFANNIRIIGNPENTLSGVVTLDLVELEYHDDVLRHTKPLQGAGETVGEFIGRTFDIEGKEISGYEVMLLIKQYVRDIHAEHTAALAPAPTDD